MTHDELMAKILEFDNSCNTSGSDKEVPKSSGWDCYELHSMASALRAVVELAGKDIEHESYVWLDGYDYAMKQIIQTIEKELG
jgi:hypothetical protein